MAETTDEPEQRQWRRMHEFQEGRGSEGSVLTWKRREPDEIEPSDDETQEVARPVSSNVATSPGDAGEPTRNTLAWDRETLSSLFLYGFLGKQESLDWRDGKPSGAFFCFDCVTVAHLHAAAAKAREQATSGEPLTPSAHAAFVQAYLAEWTTQFRMIDLVLYDDRDYDAALAAASKTLPDSLADERWWVLEVAAPKNFPGPPQRPDSEGGSGGAGGSEDGGPRGGGDLSKRFTEGESSGWSIKHRIPLPVNWPEAVEITARAYKDPPRETRAEREKRLARKRPQYDLYEEVEIENDKRRIEAVIEIRDAGDKTGLAQKRQRIDDAIKEAVRSMESSSVLLDDSLGVGKTGDSGRGGSPPAPPRTDEPPRGPYGGVRVDAYLAFETIESGDRGPVESWELLAIFEPTGRERIMLSVLVSLAQVPSVRPGDEAAARRGSFPSGSEE